MNDVPSLGSRTPESAQRWANLPKWDALAKLKHSFAALTTSVLALTSAQAGPLTRENMPDVPVVFSSSWALTSPGNFFLNDIALRVASNPSAEIFTTNWSLRFLSDGSIEMILNILENEDNSPGYSAQFDSYNEEIPWVSVFYSGGTPVWNFSGGPGYNWIDFGNTATIGTQFNGITQTSNVPEPGSLPLVVGGLVVGAAWLARRRKEGEEVVPETTPETVVWKPEESIA